MTQSMSRKGDCRDNAVAESTFKTIKVELIYDAILENQFHVEHELFSYLEGYYNQRRLHQSNNYLTPYEYETIFYKQFKKMA